MIFENLGRCGSEGFLRGEVLPEEASQINMAVHKRVQSSSFKKTEFALTALVDPNWNSPAYIRDGLKWLADRLGVIEDEKQNNIAGHRHGA